MWIVSQGTELWVRVRVDVPGGEDLIHGGTATPALHAEPLPWLWRSRLSLKDLKENTWFKSAVCISASVVSRDRPGLD